MIISLVQRAPTLESLRERATEGITTWLTRLTPGLVPERVDPAAENSDTSRWMRRFIRDVVTTDPLNRSPLSPIQIYLLELALEYVDWPALVRDPRFRHLDWSRAGLVYPRTDPGGARSQGVAAARPPVDRRRKDRDDPGDVTRLQGFAWHVRKRPGSETSDRGRHPFDGLDSKYRPPCWPIGPNGSGVRDRGPGPEFLVITPALTLGPPEVGGSWEVEPAELDDFRTEDGRIRLVGMERHRTRWGTVAECEFEVASRPSGDS